MEDAKLILVFNSLIINLSKELKKYLNYDFVRQNEDIRKVFDYLFLQAKNKERKLSKESLHQYLYGKKPYNDLRIRHLMSMSCQVLEDFIVFQSMNDNRVFKEKLLIKFYAENGLENQAIRMIEKTKDISGDTSRGDATFFRNRYEMGSLYYDINSGNIRSEDFDYQETVRSFTIYTVIEVLKSACTVNTIKKVMETDIRQDLLQPVLDFLPNSDYLQIPTVRIYYHLLQIVEKEDDAHFESLLNDIRENEDLFLHKDLNTIYRTMINFCIKKSNQNNVLFSRFTFEIYLYTIEKGILLDKGEVNRFVFTNVITIGLKLREFERSLRFLEEYQHHIHPDFVQNTIQYNLAKIHYAQQRYDSALRILLTHELKDKIWNLNAKYLILKILFEQKEFELFRSHLKSFRIYVQRIQNVGYHKTYFENVIKALQILLKKRSGKQAFIGHTFDASTPDLDWFRKMESFQ